MSRAPVREARLNRITTELTRRADGSVLMRSPDRLGDWPARLTDRLVHWARETPDQVFIARRGPDAAWRSLSYAETLEKVCAIGQALLERNLSPERPIAILSGNGIEHALLALAAMHVGIPYAPISPAYSLVSTDFGKLRHVFSLLTPGLVFADDREAFARAIDAVVPDDAELVVERAAPADRPATTFADLMETPPTAAVDDAFERVNPDTVAKILFTSGSTGFPKGVINTQRMLCSNQQMLVDTLPFMADVPPVLVDWLPWNHTFGGNHNVGLVLYNGGSLYIDDGKPVPGLFEETVRNLREIAPTIYFNVPKGFEELVTYLRAEPDLREKFFSRVNMLFYSGAGLGQHVWDALEELAAETCGERIMMITGLGATETAPYAVCANWEAGRSGLIGLPVPGLELKLTPVGSKMEARVRGPNVTPGYWRQDEATRAAFDEEGFYCMGDAIRFADPEDPQKGLLFDGRISEDFKLTTGTWVSVGPLRARVIEYGAPYVQDVVIAGVDRNEIGLLIFPNVDACRARCPDLDRRAAVSDVVARTEIRAAFAELLAKLNAASTGSSNRVMRAMVLDQPPSIDAHEVTDKGSINQKRRPGSPRGAGRPALRGSAVIRRDYPSEREIDHGPRPMPASRQPTTTSG